MKLNVIQCLCLLGVLVASAPILVQADANRALMEFEAAMKLYDQGKYAQALAGFDAANREEPAPVLRYNMAECHRKLGNTSEAIRYYQLYLEEEPAASDRTEVESRIEMLKEQHRTKTRETADQPAKPAPATQLVRPPTPAQVAATISTHPADPVATAIPTSDSMVSVSDRTLNAVDDDASLWASPWLWTGIGAAVLGTAVLVVVLSSGRDSPEAAAGDVGGVIQTLSIVRGGGR